MRRIESESLDRIVDSCMLPGMLRRLMFGIHRPTCFLWLWARRCCFMVFGHWHTWPALLLLATMDYKQPRTDISCAVPS